MANTILNFYFDYRHTSLRDKIIFALVGWESEEKEHCAEITFSSACWRLSGSEESNLSTRPKSSRKRSYTNVINGKLPYAVRI